MSELEQLRDRLRNVIVGTCNSIGCKDCDLKWDDGCQATELESQVWAIEMEYDKK